MTTVALSAASRREISFPRLRIPPVTTATFPDAVPGISTGSRGREAIAFCSSGRRTAPETRLPSSRNQSTEAAVASGRACRFLPSVRPGRTSPMFTFATGPGAVPSEFALRISARSMASVATAGRSIAWKTCTRFRSRIVGAPERSGPTRTIVPSIPSRSIRRSACQQRNRGISPKRSTRAVHSSCGRFVSGRFQSTLPVKYRRRSTRGRPSNSSCTWAGWERLTGETVAVPSPPRALIFRAIGSRISGRPPERITAAPARASAAADDSIRGTSPERASPTTSSATLPTRSGYRESAAGEGRTPGGCS